MEPTKHPIPILATNDVHAHQTNRLKDVDLEACSTMS
jgi:hypothetical protein